LKTPRAAITPTIAISAATIDVASPAARQPSLVELGPR